jgi:hypothetical protein
MSQIPPPVLNYAPPPPRNDLRVIATRQRAIMFCILGYIIAIIGQFALPPEMRFIVGIIAIGLSITASVFVFMLAIALYSTGTGIVLGILTLVPLIGLFVLLTVNGKATNLLRQHGIKVGLMGADPRQVPGP